MQTENPKPVEQPSPRKVTLAEQGSVLPIGVKDNAGRYNREIAVRPWRMKEEKVIGDLREQNPDSNMGQYISMVLATMCTHLGPNNFDTVKNITDRRLMIGQMYMADVFFAFLWLRRQAAGQILPLKPRCPSCRRDFSMNANLDTVEVVALSKVEDGYWDYTLEVPFDIRGKSATLLKMGPAIWSTMESLGTSGASRMNTGAAKAGIIRASIMEVEGLGAVPLAEHEIEDMMKVDIERLCAGIDEHNVGPNLSVEGSCPHCTRAFAIPLDWTTEDFFSTSSQ